MGRKRSLKHRLAATQEQRVPVSIDVLEKSTQINRVMGVPLAAFLSYLFFSTASITDLQLVELGDTLDLPLLNFTIPFTLVSYGYLVPAIILLGHLVFMISMQEHVIKLRSWLEAPRTNVEPDHIRKNLPFALFNLACVAGGFTGWISRRIVHFTLFVAPLVTLLYVQLRFSDLHNLMLSIAQFLCFGMDFLLVFYFQAIFLLKQKVSTWKKILRWRSFGTASACVLFLVSALDMLVVGLIAGDSTYKSVAAYMKGESPGTVIRLIFDGAYHDTYEASFNYSPDYLLPVPLLEVSNQNIDLNDAEEGAKKYCFDENTPVRDFVFVRFRACTFKLAKLLKVRMMCADLGNASLEQALLDSARLQYSNLKQASLRGSFLGGADLTEANLTYADLTKATLRAATLTRTDLRRATLDYANLSEETLLSGKLLRGASMKGINLRDAHLEYVSLEGVNLRGANLEGAAIRESNLQAAEMQDVDLRGATFCNVLMQGADLSGSSIRGALFVKCYINAINWPKDICYAKGTIFDMGMDNFLETFPTEAQLDKTHQELTAINFKTDFRGRMQRAKKDFEPHFEHHYTKAILPRQFTTERIDLMDNCDARIDHLWVQMMPFPSALRRDNIVAHNRAITDHSLKNYPDRLLKLLQFNLDKYPGAKPEASKLPFSPAH